jgi:hypothetical protein
MGFIRAVHALIILPTIIYFFKKKPKPLPTSLVNKIDPTSPLDPSRLAREIHFDLYVARGSLIVDILSHTLVTLTTPSSQFLFVAFTSLSSLGSGLIPAVQSLALCILQASGASADVGKLFGALAVIQAIGSTILGVSRAPAV